MSTLASGDDRFVVQRKAAVCLVTSGTSTVLHMVFNQCQDARIRAAYESILRGIAASNL
jgi:hypothetical protein